MHASRRAVAEMVTRGRTGRGDWRNQGIVINPSVGNPRNTPSESSHGNRVPVAIVPFSLPRVTLLYRGWITPFCVARCELQNARFAFCALNTDVHRRQSPESLKTGGFCRRELEVVAITPPLRTPSVAVEAREKQNLLRASIVVPNPLLTIFIALLQLRILQ